MIYRDMPHMRNTHRHMCSELVSLTHEQAGMRVTHRGNLEEIGECTAALLVEHPISRGTKIQINCGSNRLEGRVTSCDLLAGAGFWTEVRFSPQSRWSERWFMPQHLLILPDTLGGRTLPQVFPLGIASGY